ncbi:MAG: NADH-quinone oxidoreductase subunit L [Gemmataceae bacterium]|nr:NADH-quinone oxidoreductase subunit L [Gemmataceae bacterium]
MSKTSALLPVIVALPFLASVFTAFFGPRLLRRHSHWPCILATATACVLSCFVLAGVVRSEQPILAGYEEPPPSVRYDFTWMKAGSVDIGYTLRADGLTAIMLLTVTFVATWIAVFSIGYMSHEREHNAGYARFFAEMSLFICSMLGLVLADNFILVYAFWEGVGLCSYLLVGFWFAKPAAAAAARKALLVTRLGDVGFILGILVLWMGFDRPAPLGGPDPSVLNFDVAFRLAPAQDPAILALVCLLFLCGAVGKSAQFPLYVWLPDAMEGPTPVSALIHAATMVTAGVYLIARSMPLFHAAPPYVLMIVASIGAFTAMLAALIALTQPDLKRVLAYSTISQIGYMFLALGSASSGTLVAAAVVAGIFHLVTHAFFKALLFLSAGSVMHAMGNVIDMRRFSGLRYAMPTTHWTFLCGAGALAALPPLSGFWSKDEILGVTLKAGAAEHYPGVYVVLFLMGLLTAGLTAFYTFRAYFKTFWGELRIPPEAGDHAHESPEVMLVPLRVLAVGAVALGFVIQPLTGWFSGLLEHHWANVSFPGQPLPHVVEHGHNWVLMFISSMFGVGGVFVAWFMYVCQPGLPERVVRGMQGLYQMSLNKFHVDEIYYALFAKPLSMMASVFKVFDQYVVDSVVDLVGSVPRMIGMLLRPIQNGLVQFYALAMMLGLTVFLGALVIRMAR